MTERDVPGGEGEPRAMRVTHQSRRAAAALRGLHALASIGLVAATSFALLTSDGARRRALWDACGDLLLAHGLVGLVLVPVLLVLTARLRRGTRLPARTIAVVDGRLRLHLAEDEVLDTAAADVAIAEETTLRDGRRRLTLAMGRGVVRDRLVLELDPAAADALIAALPAGPRTIDPGVRTFEAAGWGLTLSYAAACAAALWLGPWLQHTVPLGPGEPRAALEHAGWLLGIGLAAFWVTYGAIAAWMEPGARVAVGSDGLQLTTARGRSTFVPFGALAGVERRRRGLRLLRVDGAPIDVRLGSVEARSIDDAVDVVRAARGADERPPPAPGTVREVRALAARLAREGYRSEAVTGERLEAAIASPRAGAGARVGAALALVARGEDGRRVVKVRAATLADDETRHVLEAIAEGEIDDVEIDRVLARRRHATP